MKKCQFCFGEIPDAATKCQHCGEWVNGQRTPNIGNDLGRAINRYVSFRMAIAIVGFILMLIIFFFVWLPDWNRMHRAFNSFPSFPLK